MNKELKLDNVRLAFSDGLLEAKTIAGGKPRFGCNLILEDEPVFKAAKTAVTEIAKEEFKGTMPSGKDSALRDGNTAVSSKTDEVYDGFADKHYIAANRSESQGPPLVLDNRKDPKTGKARIIFDPEYYASLDSDQKRVYLANAKRDPKFPVAGDYVNAKVSFFSLNGKNDKKGNASYGKKICAQIEVVQFHAKGNPFGASKPTSDGFDDLPEDADEDIG